MKITKLDGHKGQGKVSILEKKNFGKSGQKLPKRRYQWFIVQLQIFAQCYFALHYLEKQTFLQLAQASFKQQYFGIFQNFKVFLRKFPSSKLRFNMRHEICVNGSYIG